MRADITPDGLTFIKLTDEQNVVLKKVPLALEAGSWHTLRLRFDGPELFGTLDDTTFIATDAVFDREKAEANFLVAGGTAGLRNFSLTPTKWPPP